MPDTSGAADGGYLQRTAGRETVRFHVQRAIFCPFTNQPLDVRRPVVVSAISPSGAPKTDAIAAAHWDSRKDAVVSGKPAGYTLEVLDGRELSGSPHGKPLAASLVRGSAVRPPRAPHVGGPAPRAR